MPTVSVISSKNEKKSFEIEAGKTLYDEIEKQGMTLPHGCLAGSCGSCKVWVIEGSENLLPPSAIETNTLESIQKTLSELKGPDFLKGKIMRLSCRAKSKGNVSIEPIKLN